MDGTRFDLWTRNRALRISRRRALALMGAGGVALAADPSAEAQSPCRHTIHAETGAGPSKSTVYVGVLEFTLGAGGVFTSSTFTPGSGSPVGATGQSIGHTIDFQIATGTGNHLTFTGVSDSAADTCGGAAAGIFTGPQPGDLGAWQATAESETTQPTTNTLPPVSNSTNGSSDDSTSSTACPDGTSRCGASCVANCSTGEELDLGSCSCVSTCSGLDCGDAGCIDPTSDPANCGACGNACQTRTCTNGVCTCREDGEPCDSSTDCCVKVCSSGHCGCARLGQSCDEDAFECCDGTPTICFGGACCIIEGFSCSADADCCLYMQANGSCSNGICTRTT